MSLITQGLGSGEGLRMPTQPRGSRPRIGRPHVWNANTCVHCCARRHWPLADLGCGGGSHVFSAEVKGRSRRRA